MPKINQEEYEVLKELGDKWKWIARDESGSCFIFELKPIKDNRYELWEWVGNTNIGKIFDSSLFQFIQWEDEEPYNIQELIEEYEEEVDLKEQISVVMDRLEEVCGIAMKEVGRVFGGIGLESEETEVKSIQDLIDKWENYKNVARTVANSRAIEHADMFINDLEQLDEPEALSQEWIDEHKIVHQSVHGRNDYVPVDDLQGILVPKQELPVIPKFVAEWYESEGKQSSWWNWFYKWGRDESRTELETKTIRWMQDFNEELFVDMFRYEYEVEEEQKYQVKDNHGRTLLAKMTYSHKGKTFEKVQPYNELIVGYKKELTEQEIKDYDERFWPFAVEIEEMEE